MDSFFQRNDTLNVYFETFMYDADKQAFPIPQHWHYYTEFIYVLEGTADIECGEKSYMVYPDDLMIIHARCLHSVNSITKPLRFLAIKFDLNALNCYDDFFSRPISLFSKSEHDRNAELLIKAYKLKDLDFRFLFERCVNEGINKEFGYDVLIRNGICGIIMEIIRIWKRSGFDTDKHLLQEREGYSIDNITAYIDRHYNEKLSVQDLADMCKVSYSYFARVFREKYGRSCKEYMEYIRVCKAEEMLMHTDMDLSFISQETGFADCSHFIRIFKKFRNYTPQKYRKKYVK